MGSSDSAATHCLILDRGKLELLIAPVKEAHVFLTEQWPPEPPLRMSQEEYLAMLSQALKQVKQPEDIAIAEIQRRIDEQYALIEDMQQWLDHQLKNWRYGARTTKTIATVGGLVIPQDRRLSPATP